MGVGSSMGLATLLSWYIGVRPDFPAPTGPETVGKSYFRVPDACTAQVFYPAATEAKAQKGAYTREGAIQGLAKVTGQKKFVFSNLRNAKHFYQPNAPIKPLENGKKYGTVIFSHGLKGHCDMYSKVCADIASHGFIVVALEHEDGSACFSKPISHEKPLWYKDPPSDVDMDVHENVVKFRAPFLQHRKDEIQKALSLLKLITNGDATLDKEDEKHALEALKVADCERIWLGGHSFGAATTVFCMNDTDLQNNFKGCFLLDLWPMPISEEMMSQGISIPAVSILTEEFKVKEDVRLTKMLVQASSRMHSYYIPQTTHQQFSDSPYLMVEKLAKNVNARGDMDLAQSQQAIVAAVLALLNGSEWDDLPQSTVLHVLE